MKAQNSTQPRIDPTQQDEEDHIQSPFDHRPINGKNRHDEQEEEEFQGEFNLDNIQLGSQISQFGSNSAEESLKVKYQSKSQINGEMQLEGLDKHTQNHIKQEQKEPFPTFGQIQKSINTLARVMPEIFTEQSIAHFYQRLFEKMAPIQVPLFSPSSASNVSQQKPSSLPIIKHEHSEVYSPMTVEEQQKQQMERRIVANAFCENISFESLVKEISKKYVNLTMDLQHYQKLLGGLLNEAYSKVKQIAGHLFESIITPTPSILHMILVRCRKTLNSKACQILFRVIKSITENKVTFQIHEGLKLLKDIDEVVLKEKLRTMDKQKGSKPGKATFADRVKRQLQPRSTREGTSKTSKFELCNVWNNEYEAFFIQCHREGPSYVAMRQAFKTKFPKQADLFDVNSLRAVQQRIMRKAIRRLIRQVVKSGRTDLPPMMKLEDQLVKNIIISGDCIALRINLMEIYATQGACPRGLLIKVIIGVNEFALRGGAAKQREKALAFGYDL